VGDDEKQHFRFQRYRPPMAGATQLSTAKVSGLFSGDLGTGRTRCQDEFLGLPGGWTNLARAHAVCVRPAWSTVRCVWDWPDHRAGGHRKGVRTLFRRSRHGKDQVSGRMPGASRWLDELGAGPPGVCQARLVPPSVVFGIGLITEPAALPAVAKMGLDKQLPRLGNPSPTGMLIPDRGCHRRIPYRERAGGWCSCGGRSIAGWVMGRWERGKSI
jgi:hypothetical protein